ncbi:GAF domain-containing protein [Pajaroellobacter abortibovis]|uniref:GAF domain-containing protein n=1 Tax=Pajaroellobacter abortibovis TaxID=1882918 RepID=A0A1L6MV88_9BACT|nr:GAF domain-containing protein [Pajaroellobacter abortibovis]APR99428.1 hypothetical protein BCY86_01070 [Pajaroellobacter abortibovis]
MNLHAQENIWIPLLSTLLLLASTLFVQHFEGLHKLHEFSEKLMVTKGLDPLLETLLDSTIEVTGAEKGFLPLLNNPLACTASHSAGKGKKRPMIISRHIRQHTEAADDQTISDSIVAKVLQIGRPLMVSDTINDAQFNKSESVVTLKPSSVMCASLIAQGMVMGALYVGNDRIKVFLRKTS